MAISISNLTKKYGTQVVLNNINLEIGDGEIVGFLGPNGAGKTTTMKILTGIVPYTEGSVRIEGLEVKSHLIETHAVLGYLPENNPLYTDMYVKEYLLFVADAHGVEVDKKKLIEDLIDRVGLQSECHKKIGQLSKGYRQRVGLAQALVPNPKVLILDEPTTGLDPNQLEEIRELIRSLGKDRTVMLSTHIMQEIKAICSRVVIINQGEIVADYKDLNTISQFDENSSIFKVEFLHPIVKEKFAKEVNILEIEEEGENQFKITTSDDIRESIFDFAVKQNNKILTMHKIEQNMEDVFKSLTRQ